MMARHVLALVVLAAALTSCVARGSEEHPYYVQCVTAVSTTPQETSGA